MFVHISAVERAGLRSLNEGQTVEYEIESNRGKSPRSTSESNDHFSDASSRAYRLRVSSMWCVLLFLARMAAVLIGK